MMAYVQRAINIEENETAIKVMDIEKQGTAKATIFKLLQQEQFAEELKYFCSEK